MAAIGYEEMEWWMAMAMVLVALEGRGSEWNRKMKEA